jgi:hypothetical protein
MTAIEQRGIWRATLSRVVADWEAENPVAGSVNWHPDECAIRAINLALAAQMMAVAYSMSCEHVAPLVRQLGAHGDFVHRSITLSETRTDGYAARMTALLVTGASLAPHYSPAAKWFRYAAARFPLEVERHYREQGMTLGAPAGANQAAELLLLGLIVLDKAGYDVDEQMRERVRRICRNARPAILASGERPLERACILNLDPYPERDRCALFALAAAYLDDPEIAAPVPRPSAVVPWLLGGWERRREEERGTDPI